MQHMNCSTTNPFAWIGGINNGTHWFWNQGEMEPEAAMFSNGGVVPVAYEDHYLLLDLSEPSPASSHGSIFAATGSSTTLGGGLCELF